MPKTRKYLRNKIQSCLPKKVLLFCLGLTAFLLCLETILQASAYLHQRKIHTQHLKTVSAGGNETIKILCLGDSITSLGEGPAYPEQLQNLLEKRYSGQKFSVINMGLPGTNTGLLLSRVDQYLDQYRPHLVTLMVGNSDDLIYGGNAQSSFNPLFYKLKTYKLARLLSLHLSFKWHELKSRLGLENLAHDHGRELYRKGMINEAKKAFENSKSSGGAAAYANLIEWHYAQKDFEQAKATVKEGLKQWPNSADLWQWLVEIFRVNGDLKSNEDFFLGLMSADPTENELIFLARFYQMNGKISEAEKTLLRSLEKSPRSYYVHWSLGNLYHSLGEHKKAIGLFSKCLDISPEHSDAYFSLGMVHAELKHDALSQEFFRQATRRGSFFLSGHKTLYAQVLQSQGKEEESRRLKQEAMELRLQQISPATLENYRELTRKILNRRLPLVAMQYPNQDLELLKKMTEGQGPIFFLGNEENFQRAIREESFFKLFTDNTSGDLGHLTRRGHELIAQNLFAFLSEHVLDERLSLSFRRP